MNKLEFEDSGRTFTCEAANSRATPDQVWWWVNVSGDALRYAAFHKKACLWFRAGIPQQHPAAIGL